MLPSAQGGAREGHQAAHRAPTGPSSSLQAVQQQRTYADAAVAAKANIWDELGDLVTSDEGKRELATLRSTYTDIAQKLAKMAAVRVPRQLQCRPGSQGWGLGWGGRGGTTRSCSSRAPRACIPPHCFACSQDPEPINWAAWSKEIDPKLVQEFKQAYESERAAVQLALRCRAAACKVAASSCCIACELHMHGCFLSTDHARACAAPPAPHLAAMKLPKFEGNHVAEANAQFAALLKEAEALEAASRTRVVEIQVCEGGGDDRAGAVRSKKCWTVAAAA